MAAIYLTRSKRCECNALIILNLVSNIWLLRTGGILQVTVSDSETVTPGSSLTGLIPICARAPRACPPARRRRSSDSEPDSERGATVGR